MDGLNDLTENSINELKRLKLNEIQTDKAVSSATGVQVLWVETSYRYDKIYETRLILKQNILIDEEIVLKWMGLFGVKYSSR